MIILGIEGTAHTLGIGIMDSEGSVLSNAKREYVPKSGGIHPREASDYHTLNFSELIKESLEIAKVTIKEIDLFAFSQGPGLGPCLRNVAIASRALTQAQRARSSSMSDSRSRYLPRQSGPTIGAEQ